jgi:CheY-like chemotaxis protein
VTLTWDLSQEVPNVIADAGGLLQVITNLVENAHDAIVAAGAIHIQTGVETRDANGAQVNLPGLGLTFAVLTVADTGLGMDEATRAQIFEPFFTTKPTGQGTGLGLSVVHGIVKQSGGSIDVKSAVGEGTVFRILFPAAQVDASRQAPRSAAQHFEGIGGHETILIAEDEPSIRRFILTTLEHAGYKVLAAVDGAEALTIIEGAQLPVDLVVTDLLMPRMDGVSLGQQLARHQPRAKVLYISGGPGLIESDEPYLAKPFTTLDLLYKVREVLDASSS